MTEPTPWHDSPWVLGIGLCPACGKVRYISRRDARHRRRQLGGKGLRPYRCHGYWHLGHLPRSVRHGLLSKAEAYRDRATS